MKQKFEVTGMSCAACSASVERSVRKLNGVSDVNVSLLTNSMQVEYDPDATGPDAIISAVTGAGYGASCPAAAPRAQEGHEKAADKAVEEARRMKTRLIVSIIFWIPLMYIAMFHMLPAPAFMHAAFGGANGAVAFAFAQFLLLLPIIYVNRSYYVRGFRSLLKRAPNMDSLIALGSSAAVIYGAAAIFRIGYALGAGNTAAAAAYTGDVYFESAGTILTLITLGKFFEARSKGKTTQAITKLIDLTPKTATVVRGGAEVEIPAAEIVPGDIVAVRPGQSVPADGVIISGGAAVDESALTGESIPAEKNVGDTVSAATINRTGYFRFRAQKVGADTALSQIIRLVEDASSSKAPIARLADKISGIFVPIVMAVALAAAVVWLIAGATFSFALSAGIAVLVISCPCALGLATPVAIMVGTGKGASLGILIKSAESLETAHSVSTVVLDKTGTVTEGRPEVTDIVPAPGATADELLAAAAALESLSEHPLAQAIVRRADESGVKAQTAEDFKAIPGRGVTAKLGGVECLGGNLDYITESGADASNLKDAAKSFAESGKTPVFFSRGGKMLGVIAAADTIKPTSREAIERLHALGLDTVMLTGDNEVTARAVGTQLGIGRVVAGVMPQDKEHEIRMLQESGRKVAMIGDGINDAPALARADVGIAIGAGTDVAIESADIVLIRSDLRDAASAIELSRATMRNIRENLFWAFFYNLIGIPIAAGVFYPLLGWQLSPMLGAAAMSLSSVCVVSNALRLRFFKPRSAYHDISVSDQKQNAKGEKKTMKKTIMINGMMCEHCKAHVEQALGAIDGVSATVDLKGKRALVELSAPVSDEELRKAVTDAGYEVVSIS